MRRIAIFQHEDKTQGPGLLPECIEQQGYAAEVFIAGQPRPRSLDGFAGLVVLGSNQGANDTQLWITEELGLLKQALQRDIPVLGHCFGAQLLPRAMGARVARNPWPQIGWQRLRVTPAARALFGGREQVLTFNWHYDGFDIPRGAQRTMFGVHSLNKGFRLGSHLGFQAHFEVTQPGVEAWCAEGGMELVLAKGPGVQDRHEMLRDLPVRIAELHEISRTVYANWLQSLPRPLIAAAQAAA